jgi:peptidoglycan-N-acetylglucosamine deacetylase
MMAAKPPMPAASGARRRESGAASRHHCRQIPTASRMKTLLAPAAAALVLAAASLAPAARAAEAFAPAGGCANPAALGVSRTITLDPVAAERSGGVEVGTFNFAATLPLADKEVVLTFDDGPLPGVTDKVLAALRAECAKATFFVVGQMAAAYPDLVRAEAADGHTIATHTWSHPQPIASIGLTRGIADVDRGFAAVAAALGAEPAPFFRFPGFAMTPPLESRLIAAGIGIFSTDVMGYDWNQITPDQVRAYVLAGLAKHRGGIVLLHDIHPRTAAMLPQLLRDLKAGGYTLVAIVPASRCPDGGCRIDRVAGAE